MMMLLNLNVLIAHAQPKGCPSSNSSAEAQSQISESHKGIGASQRILNRPKSIQLLLNEGKPTYISFFKPGTNIQNGGILTSLQNTPVLGLSYLEMKTLVYSSKVTPLNCVYIETLEKRLTKETLERNLSFPDDLNYYRTGIDVALSQADKQPLRDFFFIQDNYHDNNLHSNNDIALTINLKQKLSAAKDAPIAIPDALTITAAEGAYYSLKAGNITRARNYLNLLFESTNSEESLWRYLQQTAHPFVNQLLVSGELQAASRAIEIGRKYAEKESNGKSGNNSVNQKQPSADEWKFLIYRAQLLDAQKAPDLIPHLDMLFKTLKELESPEKADIEVIAELLSCNDKLQEASTCYALLVEQDLATLDCSGENLFSLLDYDSHCHKLANIRAEFGDLRGAIEILQSALAYNYRFIDKQTIVELEKCNHLRTSTSDMELLMANLQMKMKDGQSAVNHCKKALNLLEGAFGEDNYLLLPAKQVMVNSLNCNNEKSRSAELKKKIANQIIQPKSDLLSASEEFALLKSAYDSLNNKDFESTRIIIGKLVAAYKSRGPNEVVGNAPYPNLYCALTQISRRLSDEGAIEQSDDLLCTLREIMPIIEDEPNQEVWLQIEQAVNQSRRSMKVDWHYFEDNQALKSFPKAEKYRLLASLFHQADELERARIFAQHGLECAAQSPLERANLLLENACLNIHLNLFEEADKQSIQALAIAKSACHSSTKDKQHQEYMKVYRDKLALLARLNTNQKRYSQSHNLLEQALKDLSADEIEASLDSKSNEKTPSLFNEDSDSKIELELARCLLTTGDARKALAILQDTKNFPHQNTNSFDRELLMTACSIKLNQTQNLSEYYQQLSDYASNFGKPLYSEAANYYSEESNKYKPRQTTNAKTLEQLQNVLLEKLGTSTGKIDLFSLMLPSMPDNIETQELQSDINAYATNVSKMPQSEQEKQKLILLIRIAELSEKYNLVAATRSWLSVAEFEIQIGKYQECCDHIERAISQANKQELIPNSVVQIKSLAKSLTAHGYQGDTEPLLIGCSQKYEGLYGRSSLNFLETLSALAAFYADKNLSQKARDTVDQLLAINIRKQENSFWFNDDTPISLLIKDLAPSEESANNNISADDQSSNKSTKTVEIPSDNSKIKTDQSCPLRLELLKQILKAQRAQLGPDDLRLAITLTAIGKLQSKLNTKDSALDSCREALRISKLYDPDSNDVKALQLVIANIQNKKPPKDETWKESIDRSSKGYLFTTTDTSDFYLSTDNDDQKLQKLQVVYKGASKLAPYSLRSSCLLAAMIPLAQSLNNNALLADLLKDQLAIYEHRPLSTLPSKLRMPQSLARLQLYVSFVDTLAKLGHTEEAKTEALNASEILPSILAKRELDLLIKLNKSAGNDDLAAQYTKQLQALPERNL